MIQLLLLLLWRKQVQHVVTHHRIKTRWIQFAVSQALLVQQAEQWGCAPPQVLLRAMFNGLWLLQRTQT